MSAPILTVADVVTCPHGGRVAMASTSPRVLVAGAPVLTLDARGAVQGCPLPLPATCVSVQWHGGASRVLASGRPVLLRTSAALAIAATGAPNGPPVIAAGQSRVLAQ